MNKLAAILCVLLLASCNVDRIVKKADQKKAIGEYFEAANLYRKAYMRTPVKEKAKRGARALAAADCYRRIAYTARAMGSYANAMRYKVSDSTALFYLAEMQKRNGDYKNAIETYEAYLQVCPTDTLAINGLAGARQAPIWKEHPSNYSIKKEPTVNGRRSDYCPQLLGDDADQLYVSTTRPQVEGDDLSGITGMKPGDIFFCRKDDKGKWTQMEAVEGELNTEYDEGACCFAPDGKTMYVTRCATDPSYPRYAQILTSQRSDATWGAPKPVTISNDTLTSYAHPAISPDGRWLYFTSDMPGGFGGLDIWRCDITTKEVGAPENLGPEINTPGDECFPAFRPNGEFYFSSNGHVGMGGLDIFVCMPIVEEEENGAQPAPGTSKGKGKGSAPKNFRHGKPVNLGVPMNSSSDDFGMTWEGIHNRGYFSTNRGDARGWDHIMSFSKPEILQTVKGWVYEKDGYELPEAVVYMVGNDGTNLKLSVRGDGSFTQLINPNVDYVLLGTCKGFLNCKQELRVDTVGETTEYTLQFPLSSITSPVLVRNVFYEFDRADITPDSRPALDSLITLLKENPNVTIELASHTDFRGSDAYNMRLSQRRAESVVNYLIEGGIAKDRLTPVGYGESRPKVVTRKVNEQHQWLAIGDTLTEAYITALKEAERVEICHALNRRTEFRVLRTTYGL